MVRLYIDKRMLDHVPPMRHPESPERLSAIMRHLDRLGLAQACRHGKARLATDEELLQVHQASLLHEVAHYEEQGGGLIDSDTWDGAGSNLAARLAAGAVADAVAGVLGNRDKLAFCAVRPPGHHATSGTAMGFCLFNSVAVGAAKALSLGVERVLIVDWDVHHGNGTQDIFYQDPRVGFLSIHRYPFYPGTGAAGETGTGPGLGTTLNLPISYGTTRADFRAAFRAGLEAMADRMKPELVLLSAGFDAHAADPIGGLSLESEDFVDMTHEVLAIAKTHAHGRLVGVLEGGYNIQVLAECVAAHLEALGVHPVHEMGPH
jgi:acetoin utilization deacetylase AcuC-like enzyme